MERAVTAAATIPVDLAEVRGLLLSEPAAAFGAAPSMRIPVGAAAGVVANVALSLGGVAASDDRVALAVRWHASSLEALLPSFDGELVAVRAVPPNHTIVRLDGSYAIPLGLLGRFGDGLAGRRLARSSVEELVRGVALRLVAEADRRRALVRWRPGEYPVALAEAGDGRSLL